MHEQIKLSLPGKPEYVSIARMTASVIANKIGFNIEEIEDIKVAVGEACNNAVIHGGGNEECYEIQFEVNNNKMIIEIIDNGNGFQQDNYQEPNLGDLRENGLGIFIMKTLMDEVEFLQKDAAGTTIRLVKELN